MDSTDVTRSVYRRRNRLWVSVHRDGFFNYRKTNRPGPKSIWTQRGNTRMSAAESRRTAARSACEDNHSHYSKRIVFVSKREWHWQPRRGNDWLMWRWNITLWGFSDGEYFRVVFPPHYLLIRFIFTQLIVVGYWFLLAAELILLSVLLL